MGDLDILGGLTKPATVLIEKISGAIGVIHEPTHIKRKGKAEAEAKQYAAIMEAETQIQITEIQKRGLQRSICEEGIKQQNIEDITLKAIPRLSTDAKPENIENDWLAHFFDKCRLTSDEQMQQLWANILAGEANLPSSFSKRTIDLVASLDKRDAESFTKLCSFCWYLLDHDNYNSQRLPIMYLEQNNIYDNIGFNYESFLHLQAIGLITLENIMEYQCDISKQKQDFTFDFAYNGNLVKVDVSHGKDIYKIELLGKKSQEMNCKMCLGQVSLTKSGRELAKICNANPSKEYFDYILYKWVNIYKYTVCTPIFDNLKPATFTV
jgi:hypothetical protein